MIYQYGHHGVGGWGFLMILGMLAFWALLIVLGVAVYRLSSAQSHLPAVPVRAPDAEQVEHAEQVEQVEQVLARRFAAGEIDEAEYTARLAVLREQHRQ